MKELCEIRIVKNSLFEYANSMKEEQRLILKENYDLVKKINSLTYVNEIIQDDRKDLRINLNTLKEELNENKLLNQNLEIENKKIKNINQSLENDFFELKNIYRKENFELKFDLEKVIGERDEVLSQLKNIKDFFIKMG